MNLIFKLSTVKCIDYRFVSVKIKKFGCRNQNSGIEQPYLFVG